jgi:hypothetical protein
MYQPAEFACSTFCHPLLATHLDLHAISIELSMSQRWNSQSHFDENLRILAAG